jgi:ribosome-associated protein
MTDKPGFIRLAPGITLAAGAITFSHARSGGPGGQHVNTTESKVELRVAIQDIHGLSVAAATRLATLAGQRLTADGEIILTCDETRSQRSNKLLVVERLQELIRDALVVPKIRKRSRPSRGSIERRLQNKAATSERKKNRQAREE